MDLNELIAQAGNEAGDDRISQLKELITGNDGDADALETAATEAFQQAYNNGEYSADDAPAMALLADVVDAARMAAQETPASDDGDTAEDEQNGQDQEDGDAVKNRVSELANRVGQTQNKSGDSGKSGKPQAKKTTKKGGDREEADRSDRSGDRDVESEEGSEEEGETGRRHGGKSAGQAVSAARRTLSSQELNAHRTNNSLPRGRAKRSYTVTAGADLPDRPQGQQLSIGEMAEAARTRMSAMPASNTGQGEMRRSIAQVNRVYDEAHTVDGVSPMEDAGKIDALANEKNLPGGSLVAAAQQQEDNLTAAGMAWDTPPGDVWCAPSETDYTLCEPLATRYGMLDLPSFTVRHGGIRYPVWKQFPEQRRPHEHGPGDQENSNDQAQGWWPSNMPPENYPYDAQYASDGPRHDWHGYVHANRNQIGASPDLEDPDYFLKNPKKHIQGPCVEWAEERMHSSYLWIEEDILRNHVWPELAERFMEDALVQHSHFMNETYIKWIVGHSDRLDPFWAGAPGWGGPGDPPQNGIVPAGPQSYPFPVATNNYYPGSSLDVSSWGRFGMGSAAEAVLEKVGQLVTWFRNTYRTAPNRSLEGFAPWWFREFLKLDIERKLNRDHKPNVTNSEVDAYLRAWGVNLQWVYDFEDMPSTEYVPPYEDVRSEYVMPRDGWPNAVDIVLYPAGAWVLAEQNVIRLEGAMYDHDRLRNNKYTSLFMEDAWMLLNRCNRSFIVQLRGLCANGATGEPRDACSSDVIPAQRERLTTTKDKIVKGGGKGSGNGGSGNSDNGSSQGQGNGGSKKQSDS